MAKIAESEWIWRDGEWLPWHNANVHILAHSVQFGSAVFEGVRCYPTSKGPAIFRLKEHLKRMFDSCKIYRMPMTFTPEQILQATRELVNKNNLDTCYIRWMSSAPGMTDRSLLRRSTSQTMKHSICSIPLIAMASHVQRDLT